MKTPNWKTCTEEELWKFIAFHLISANISSVLVGGAVVAIYSKGAYHSGDLDLIVERQALDQVQKILENLGFEKIHGRHFEHRECQHLIIDFPPGPVSIGDDFKISPDEIKVQGKSLKIFSPTDCIRDRLASYIHFNSRECLDQAVLVAKLQPFDLKKVKVWCLSEGGAEAFQNFLSRLKR